MPLVKGFVDDLPFLSACRWNRHGVAVEVAFGNEQELITVVSVRYITTSFKRL
jgi:hypothetical protein